MVSTNQDIRLQFKRANSQYWNDTDPILQPGEPGYDTDSKFFKIGDGVTPWSQLQYQKEGSQNYILNSSFNVWQRGTSFTSVGYTADRWYLSERTATTISRQNRDAGAYGSYILRLVSTADTNSCSIFQPLESIDVKRIAGKTVTFSFYAYSSTGSEFLTYSIMANTTADVASTGTWTNIVSNTITVSSSDANDLRRYSITATIPYDGTAEGVAIKFNTSNIANGSSINIFDVQLEDGPAPTDFKRRHNSITAETLACQRFYQLHDIIYGNCDSVWKFATNPLGNILRISPTSIIATSIVTPASGGSLGTNVSMTINGKGGFYTNVGSAGASTWISFQDVKVNADLL